MVELFARFKRLSHSNGIRKCNTCYWKQRHWVDKILTHLGLSRWLYLKYSTVCTFEHNDFFGGGLGLNLKSCRYQTEMPARLAQAFPEYNIRCTTSYNNWAPFNTRERFLHKLKNRENLIVSG